MKTVSKKSLIIGLMLLGLSLSGLQQAEAGRVAERLDNQRDRIEQGVKSGELTRNEAKTLIKEEKRIAHVRKDALSDGKLDKKERVVLENMQDRANDRIYRLKHNNASK